MTYICSFLPCLRLNSAQPKMFAAGQTQNFLCDLCVHLSHSSLFLFLSFSSSLRWQCDWIFGIHPFSQLPSPLSTQQRLWLAYYCPLWLCHFLGFHQVIWAATVSIVFCLVAFSHETKQNKTKCLNGPMKAHGVNKFCTCADHASYLKQEIKGFHRMWTVAPIK